MCKCTPIKRTPWCGAPGCEEPEQEKTLQKPRDYLLNDGPAEEVLHALSLSGHSIHAQMLRDKIIYEKKRADDNFKNWSSVTNELTELLVKFLETSKELEELKRSEFFRGNSSG